MILLHDFVTCLYVPVDSHGDYRRIVTTANFHYQSNRCRRDDVEMWRRKKQRQHLFNENLYQWHEDIIHYTIFYLYFRPTLNVFQTKFWNDQNILVFQTKDQHGASRVFQTKISGILDRPSIHNHEYCTFLCSAHPTINILCNITSMQLYSYKLAICHHIILRGIILLRL